MRYHYLFCFSLRDRLFPEYTASYVLVIIMKLLVKIYGLMPFLFQIHNADLLLEDKVLYITTLNVFCLCKESWCKSRHVYACCL